MTHMTFRISILTPEKKIAPWPYTLEPPPSAPPSLDDANSDFWRLSIRGIEFVELLNC